VDGKLSFVGLPEFRFNKDDVLKPWHIETEGGLCILDFEPVGERWGKVNALLIMSDFHQPYGTFRGTAIDSDGVTRDIDYFGVTEHHLARY